MNNPSPSVSTASTFSQWIEAVFTRLELIQLPGVLVAIAAQFILLGGMILTLLIPHASGTTVWLKVVPVDPRDMFKGDYVILSYEMNRPSFMSRPNETMFDDSMAGTEIYVTLVPDADGIHHRADLYLPKPPPSGLYIRGTTLGWGRVEYGIEKFFVQAGTGLDYEEAARSGTLSAEIALGRDGQAGVNQLEVNKR